MKHAKSAIVSTFVFLGAVFIVMLATVRIPAGPPAPVASGNGDTNGDGVIDVSDAVHLLLYLFKNGEPPAAIAQNSPAVEDAVMSIDKTVSALAAEVGETNARLDAAISQLERISSAVEVVAGETPCDDNPSRFIDNGDGTVTDSCRKLMWQKTAADFEGSPEYVNFSGDAVQRDPAEDYVQNLALGGHSDWRLPTVDELRSISVDWSIYSLHPMFGTAEGPAADLWTSTPAATSAFNYYVVHDGQAARPDSNRGVKALVLAVRDAN